jgi:uncharacterized coiled-coil protein SlyX
VSVHDKAIQNAMKHMQAQMATLETTLTTAWSTIDKLRKDNRQLYSELNKLRGGAPSSNADEAPQQSASSGTTADEALQQNAHSGGGEENGKGRDGANGEVSTEGGPPVNKHSSTFAPTMDAPSSSKPPATVVP